jgi:hypothetical protein
MRSVMVVMISILLVGCAKHSWAPGPQAAILDYDQQSAQCSLMARHGGSGFYAAGNPNFVAGAAVGHAIGEGIRTQQDFNDCMMASGWKIADQQVAAANAAAAAAAANAAAAEANAEAAAANAPASLAPSR